MAFQATVSFQLSPVDDRDYAGQTILFTPTRNDTLSFVAGTGAGQANSVAYKRASISILTTINLRQCIDPLNVSDPDTYCNFTNVKLIYIHNESDTETLSVAEGDTYPSPIVQGSGVTVGPGDTLMLSNYKSGWTLSTSANALDLSPSGSLTYVIVLIGSA